MNTKLDFHLQGAPNFRVADLNVYGVAQPTVVNIFVFSLHQIKTLSFPIIGYWFIYCFGIIELSSKK